jgi:3(or 17)beta-hydroxysteroid dehydrogenase
MGQVDGLVAIVTGGGSGLGLADAELLVREGARVIVTDINQERGEAAVRQIGPAAQFLKQDVANESDWQYVVGEALDRFGRLDILVNNAGLVIIADPEATTLEQFRLANSVMSEGVFLGCKHVIPAMARSGGGSIINMASTASHLGFANLIAYSAAKGAVRSMTKSVAMYCQEKGYKIRCNSIHAGSIETPMVQFAKGRVGVPQSVPDGVLPAGAIGAPSDVANMVLFLASPQSRFMTGAELVIDNGLTVRSQ